MWIEKWQIEVDCEGTIQMPMGKKIIGIPGKKKKQMMIIEMEIDTETIIEMFIRRKIINNSVINLVHWKTSNFSKDVSVVNC